MGGDIQLKQHVEDELKWQPGVNEAAIGVSVKGGVVTLMGTVQSFTEKLNAERAVMRIRGVKALASELTVALPGSQERSDEDIARAAVTALQWNATLPKDAIKIKVVKGFVTLSGTVEWSFQIKSAERSVSHLYGVKGVLNQIRLKASRTPSSAEIRSGIEAALKRSAEVEARRIEVEVKGSTVTLVGNVSSWPERDAAERAAWAAPGILKVDNQLLVNVPVAVAA